MYPSGLNHIIYVLTWDQRTCTGGSGVVWHVPVRFKSYYLCTYLRPASMYWWFWCSLTCTCQVKIILFMYLLETNVHVLVVLVKFDMYMSGLNHIIYVLTWDQRKYTDGFGVVWHVHVRFKSYCLCTYLRPAYMHWWFWCSLTCICQV